MDKQHLERQLTQQVGECRRDLVAARVALGVRLHAGEPCAAERQSVATAQAALDDAESQLLAVHAIWCAIESRRYAYQPGQAAKQADRLAAFDQALRGFKRKMEESSRLSGPEQIELAAGLVRAARATGTGMCDKQAEQAVKDYRLPLGDVKRRADQLIA